MDSFRYVLIKASSKKVNKAQRFLFEMAKRKKTAKSDELFGIPIWVVILAAIGLFVFLIIPIFFAMVGFFASGI